MITKTLVYLQVAVLALAAFVSCNDVNSVSEAYVGLQRDAQIYAFSIAQPNDKSIEDSAARATDSLNCIELGKTNFAIDQVRSIIYNPTPMAATTVLRKVKITLSVHSDGVSSSLVETPDSVYYWNRTDSVDFSKQPVYITIKSLDDTLSVKRYRIKCRIYAFDPDSIRWQATSSLPFSTEQKTVFNAAENTFYSFARSGSNILVSKATPDDMQWSVPENTTFPTSIDLQHILTFNNKFYAAVPSTGQIYASDDGKTATDISCPDHIIALYGILPGADAQENKMLCAVKNTDGTFQLGLTRDFVSVELTGLWDALIPVSNYTADANPVIEHSDPVLALLGGKDPLGAETNRYWWFMNNNGQLQISAAPSDNYFDSPVDALFFYDNMRYALSTGSIYLNSVWNSVWTLAEKQSLPAEGLAVSGQSVCIDTDNYIYLFGGTDASLTYVNEVWKGKLNRFAPSSILGE